MKHLPLRRLALTLVAACAFAQGASAEELVIPGSGNPEYVLAELAKAFNAQQGAHRVTVPASSGTAGALRDVEADTTSLGRVGRPLKDDERARGLSYLPLGRDPVVFVAGAGVTARSITSEQAVAVYRGTLTDWRELGAKPGPIRAVGRETTDASRQAMGRAIKAFDTLVLGDNVKLVHLDPQLLELLDRYPTSLGFINRSALGASKSAVVPLALDGVEGSPQNVDDGRYKVWLEFGLIHKATGPSAAGAAFIAYVRSSAGQRILREHGVLPVTAGR